MAGEVRGLTSSMGADSARKQEALSNQLIFIMFLGLCAMGMGGVVLIGTVPDAGGPVVIVPVAIVYFAMLATLGHVLFQRAGNARDAARFLGEKHRLIEEVQGQILALEKHQKELRRAYREEKVRAEAASRSKAAFLAHLSHDIRTPLNHIIGFAELISHQAFGPLGHERYADYARDIKKSGESLFASVADILELAELESGQRILSISPIDVDALFRSIKTRHEARARRCGIQLEVECSGPISLSGDRQGLERLLNNLVDNALRFTRSGGKVRLCAWTAQDGVVLEVTDTGIGIAPEKLENLFNPFTLEDGQKPREHSGMGLGLAIARAIAELSGGEIAIDSSPALGTTVAVSLPFQQPAATVPHPEKNVA